MKHRATTNTLGTALLALLFGTSPLMAFDSGSTGEDGEFHPTVDTELELPDDGIFHFTDVNIPDGVTVRFDGNVPVTILATGDVSVAGTIDISGGWSTPVGAAGDGNIGDDGLPGEGGPGGFDGGHGGAPGADQDHRAAGAGVGPGGGGPGGYHRGRPVGGGGAGFGTEGRDPVNVEVGPTYGSEVLLPLIGGSGGGGGFGGAAFHGSGGGGGGGALLIAASGTANVTGEILAVGGSAGDVEGAGIGGAGGGGSGGAIRIVADRITGNGDIVAASGDRGNATDTSTTNPYNAGQGGSGRIRLEANTFERTADTSPNFSFDEPSAVFVPGLPALRIESVAGHEAPERPTGTADIVLPSDTANPVTVVFRTSGVPLGNTVTLTVSPSSGDRVTAISNALDGEMDSATAQVDVELPEGPSTLLAETTYTIVDEEGDDFAIYTGGEPVAEMRLTASADGHSSVTLVTESGREVTVPSTKPAMPAGQG